MVDNNSTTDTLGIGKESDSNKQESSILVVVYIVCVCRIFVGCSNLHDTAILLSKEYKIIMQRT
jgi:hypothetical protein